MDNDELNEQLEQLLESMEKSKKVMMVNNIIIQLQIWLFIGTTIFLMFIDGGAQ